VTSADAGVPAVAAPSRRRAGEAGFTLVEMVVAFAILAIAMAYMSQIQNSALQQGAKARDLRDMRVMSDTVFRKLIYEIWRWQDGASSTADVWYGDVAGLKGLQRDQWRPFRLVFHKQQRMAAGNDPTGKIETLDSSDPDGTRSTTRPTGSGTSGMGTGTSGTGSGTGSTDPATQSGEPVYVVSLDVFMSDENEQPDMTLHTIVPVPESELEQDK
jgi:prepilin-type N-terminal cleavage/methylation domain-containing protein